MNKLLLLPLFCVWIVFLSAGASLAGDNNTNTLELKGGSFMPTGNLKDDEWERGTSFELASSSTLSEGGLLQFSLGQYTTDLDNSGYDPALGRWKEDYTITVLSYTASLIGVLDHNRFHYYGGGGIGYYFAKIEGSTEWPDAGFTTMVRVGDSVIGVHMMAGLEYDIADSFFMGIEGKLIRTNESRFEIEDKGLRFRYDTKLDGNIIALKLGYRF